MKRRHAVAAFAFCAVAGVCAARRDSADSTPWPSLARYDPMSIPPRNPMTPAKVALGKQLFFDRRMSGDASAACVSCHQPEHGLTDSRRRSVGAYGQIQGRACPTLWNVGYQQAFFWEGSSPTLESAVEGVWRYVLAPGKGWRASAEDVARRLNAIPGYRTQFRDVFGQEATVANVSRSLAAFLRTLVANRSAWVRFQDGDEAALSPAARRGWTLFDGKAACSGCHNGVLLTDLQYHNVGIGTRASKPDLGRFDIVEEPRYRGAFKTPTLLNVSRSAPYFHDGSVATLPAAVDQMLAGGLPNPHLDPSFKPVKLTPGERQDLLAFLRALTVDFELPPPALAE